MSKIVCPHCGASEGYYSSGYISGTADCGYDAEGNELEDEFEIDWGYDSRMGGVAYYCNECNKDITKTIEKHFNN